MVIDQGGQSSRAVVYSGVGEILASAQCAIASKNQGLQVEQNLDEVLQSVQTVITKAFAALTTKQQQCLQSAALIVQRASFVAVDKTTGQALTEVISWQDTRNIALPAIEEKIAWQQQITGLRPNAHLGASKMAWLLKNNAKVSKAGQKNNLLFMPLGAVISAWLTGIAPKFCEPSLAQRTGLFDIHTKQFSESLCKHYDVPINSLPKINQSLQNHGQLQCLPMALPLQFVAGDQNALPFALGFKRPKTLVNIGTGAFVLSPCAKNCEPPKGLLKTLLFSDNQQSYFALEGTVNNAANSLQALLKEHGQSFDAKSLSQALAEENAPGVCDNRLHGTGSPYWLEAKPLKFVGSQTKRQQQVAVLESIVFAVAVNLYAIMQKQTLKEVLVAGGLSQFDGLCQRLANVTGIEVLRSQSAELSSEAAAVLCLQQAQNSNALQKFEPKNDAALNKRFQQFKQLLP